MNGLHLALLAAWMVGGTAFAQADMIIDARYGVTRFSGSLSGESAAPSYGVDLEFRNVAGQRQINEKSWLSRNLHGFAAGVLLSFLQIDTKAKDDTAWPVEPGGGVSLFASGIGTRFCALTVYDVHPCARFLIGSLDVSHSSSWRQSYGTPAFGLSVEGFALGSVHVSAEVEWRDQDQTVDDKKSSFHARSQLLSVGYVL